MAKYQEIREVLLERITDGTWTPGTAIPNEAVLAEEFGVTRPTINRAMRDLVDGGLVERRRRAGSRVALRRTPDAVLRIPVVRDEIEGRGGTYSHLVISRDITPPPPSVRAVFGLSPRQPALWLRSLHFDSGRPHQIEDRWINLEARPEARDVDFAVVSANEWLVRHVPYTRAEQVLYAASASGDEADLLRLPAAAPVFVIERTTWTGERSNTQVRLVNPAESFRLVTRDGW